MLRSVDMQQVISQISYLEKAQSVKQQQQGMEHRHFALQLKEEDAHNRSEVGESKESNKAEIRDEGNDEKRKREQGRLKAGDREDNSPERTEKPVEIHQGRIVDIIV